MNTPHLFQVSSLVEFATTVKQEHPEAGWIPTRPLGFQGLCLRRRLHIAWNVFTGRYDAVSWEHATVNDLLKQALNTVQAAKTQERGGSTSALSLAVGSVMEQAGVTPFMYYNVADIHKEP
jgi:hypothetical protein